MCILIEKEIQAATIRGELELVDILTDINNDYVEAAVIREQLMQVDIYSACDSM